MEHVEQEPTQPAMGDKLAIGRHVGEDIDHRRPAMRPGPSPHGQPHPQSTTLERPETEKADHGPGEGQGRRVPGTCWPGKLTQCLM
jgi:hypothetical protein